MEKNDHSQGIFQLIFNSERFYKNSKNDHIDFFKTLWNKR